MQILLLLASVVANVTGNVMFKHAMNGFPEEISWPGLFHFAFNPFLWAGGICGVLVLVFYLLAIRDSGLSASYAFVTSASVVALTVTSAIVFREPLSLQSLAGVVLVIGGIFLISTASIGHAQADDQAQSQPAE